jgi:predicted transcriptional regulator
MMSGMAARSFELSDELSARLDDLAAETGQSADEIVRAALEQRLERIASERNRGLLERIAERLQEVDYADIADESIARMTASEMSNDPLDAITSGGPDYRRMSEGAGMRSGKQERPLSPDALQAVREWLEVLLNRVAAQIDFTPPDESAVLLLEKRLRREALDWVGWLGWGSSREFMEAIRLLVPELVNEFNLRLVGKAKRDESKSA